MSEIVEGTGSCIEGAFLGRAVEPRRGAIASQDRPIAEGDTATCLNCGAYAPGAYCPECGQKTHVHRTLSAIGHDLMHGVLHLDGKLFKTLPLLAFQPGRLTRRYIDGERASFVSPMAMFLFSVFAMFAVFQIVGIGVPDDLSVGSSSQRTVDEIAEERANLQGERAALERELKAADAPGERGFISGEISGINAELQALETVSRALEPSGADNASVDDAIGGDGEGPRETGRAAPIPSLEQKRDNANPGGKVSSSIDLPFAQKLVDKWNTNPGLMLYKLQANAYKFSWLLIPLSIPFVWLLFAWRRRFKAYDHAVFVTYSLAFMSLLFIALSIASVLGVSMAVLATIGTLVPPVHIYKQLRGTYALARFSAGWRLCALSFFIVIVATLFLQMLLLLGGF